MTRLQQEGDEAAMQVIEVLCFGGCGKKLKVTSPFMGDVLCGGCGSGNSQSITSKLPAAVQPEDDTALPALLCECGHSRNAHYSGRLSCVHGSKEWCNCEKFVARKDTAMPIETVEVLPDLIPTPADVMKADRIYDVASRELATQIRRAFQIDINCRERQLRELLSTLSATQRELEEAKETIDVLSRSWDLVKATSEEQGERAEKAERERDELQKKYAESRIREQELVLGQVKRAEAAEAEMVTLKARESPEEAWSRGQRFIIDLAADLLANGHGNVPNEIKAKNIKAWSPYPYIAPIASEESK